MILYHGSKKKVEEFKPMIGTTSTVFGDAPVQRAGYFFTPDKGVAESYAGTKGFVHHVKLDMKNPFDMREGVSEKMEQDFVNHGGSTKWLYNGEPTWEKLDGEDGTQFTNILSHAGYDGIIFKEHNEDLNKTHESHVVFDPKKIEIVKTHQLNEDEAPTVSVGNEVIDVGPVVTKEMQKKYTKKKIKSFKEFLVESPELYQMNPTTFSNETISKVNDPDVVAIHNKDIHTSTLPFDTFVVYHGDKQFPHSVSEFMRKDKNTYSHISAAKGTGSVENIISNIEKISDKGFSVSSDAKNTRGAISLWRAISKKHDNRTMVYERDAISETTKNIGKLSKFSDDDVWGQTPKQISRSVVFR